MMKVIMMIIFILIIGLSYMLISTNHVWAQDYYAVPQWTKEISDFWSHGQLSDIESVNAFQYLIDEKIIVIPSKLFDNTATFDKKVEFTKTLSNFLWNESPESADIKSVTTAQQQSTTYFIYIKPLPQEAQFTSDQILKSEITVYNVDKINNNELATIVRHELGHAFGLAHSDDQNDLMFKYVQSSTPYEYISNCDVEAMAGLYDGNQKSHVICTK